MNMSARFILTEWLRDFSPSLFTSVMGIAGLAISWRVAHGVVMLNGKVGEFLAVVAFILFSIISILYVVKALAFKDSFLMDFKNIGRLCFVPAIPTSCLLLSILARPYDLEIATILWIVAAPANLLLAVVIVSRWLFEEQKIENMTAGWFFPIVGNAVVPIAGVPLGLEQESWPFFSISLVFWLIIFSGVFLRLAFEKALQNKQIPTMAIMISPPATLFIAYTELSKGNVDVLSMALIYTAFFMFFVLFIAIKKFYLAPTSMALWSITFPLASLTIATFKFFEATNWDWLAWGGVFFLSVTTISVTMVIFRSILAIKKSIKLR
jgi:tellurite resistance protein